MTATWRWCLHTIRESFLCKLFWRLAFKCLTYLRSFIHWVIFTMTWNLKTLWLSTVRIKYTLLTLGWPRAWLITKSISLEALHILQVTVHSKSKGTEPRMISRVLYTSFCISSTVIYPGARIFQFSKMMWWQICTFKTSFSTVTLIACVRMWTQSLLKYLNTFRNCISEKSPTINS